jgi:proline racemase
MDAAQAAGRSWFPVAHRWVDAWDGHTLSVVFEYRPAPPPAHAVPQPADLATPPPESARPAQAVATPVPEGPAAAPDLAQQPEGSVSAARAHASRTMQTIDLHCAGEPLRLIRSGYPQVPLAPILERRRWVREHADAVRRILMHEPRGHRDMYGAVLLPPYRPDADIAVLWMHNEGYSTMCGHGIIAVTTALVEERLFPAVTPETVVRFEVPAGLVTARAQVRNGSHGGPEVDAVRFTNVPSYLAMRDLALRPDGVQLAGRAAADGVLRADLAYGGAYYGIVDAADLGLRVVPEEADRLMRAGAAITELLRREHTPTHPTEPDLSAVYGTIIVDADPRTSPDGRATDADVRNVTIFADAEVDRSPCGTGTSALLAQRHARGLVAFGQDLVNAGITGAAFRGRVDGTAWLGSQEAVETSIEGRAWVTGYHTFVVDDRDPLAEGFLLQ